MERQVRLAAGSPVLGGVLGGVLASLRWPTARFLSGAVGAGLTYAALSSTRAMSRLLRRFPYDQAGITDSDEAVTALTRHAA